MRISIEFSLSDREVVLEVPWKGKAWGQASLKNEGKAIFFFSLNLHYEERQNKGFYAWPVHGVVLPGDIKILHFGFHASNERGLQYCDWQLDIYSSDEGPDPAQFTSVGTPDEKFTTIISTVAAVAPCVRPIERLWNQNHLALKCQSIRAAEYILHLLVKEVVRCALKQEERLPLTAFSKFMVLKFVNHHKCSSTAHGSDAYFSLHVLAVLAFAAGLRFPFSGKGFFGLRDQQLSLVPSPPFVHSSASLHNGLNALQLTKAQQLELLHFHFNTASDGFSKELLPEGKETEAHIPTESKANSKADTQNWDVAASKAGISAFAVQLRQQEPLVHSSQQPLQRQEYSWILQQSFYQCNNASLYCEEEEKVQELAALFSQTPLYKALSTALDAFPIALSQALDLAGIVGTEGVNIVLAAADEKRPQSGRVLKRSINRGRHDSRTSDDGNTNSATALAAAAVTAVTPVSGRSVRTQNDLHTAQQIAERLLQWLLSDIFATVEPQLALHAAAKTTAIGGVVAETARLQHRRHPHWKALHQLLQRIPLTVLLDPRVTHMAEYLYKKQAITVRNCQMVVVLFDGKTMEELILLLQQRPTAGQRLWMQELLQERLRFLGRLLLDTKRGALLCLEISPQFQEHFELQQPLLLQKLTEELVTGYVLPIILAGNQQQHLLSIVCLNTTEELGCLVDEAFSRREQCATSSPAESSQQGSTAVQYDEEVEESRCLFVVPSWYRFSAAAMERLSNLQNKVQISLLLSAPEERAANENAAVISTTAPAGKSNYLAVQRELSELVKVLGISCVVLDSPSHAMTVEQLTAETTEQDMEKDPAGALAYAAAAQANSPWVLHVPVTKALGFYVVSYIQAACLLLGVDPLTLQQRTSEAIMDWKDESQKRISLDAAIIAAKRRMQRHLKPLATARGSCCSYEPASNEFPRRTADSSSGSTIFTPRPDGLANNAIPAALPQETLHVASALFCSYWDTAFPTSPGLAEATGTPACQSSLLNWASLQLQQLRTLVSGTIVSTVLLAGDLVSLICGLALNGDIELRQSHLDLLHQKGDEPLGLDEKADAAAAAAAKAAAADAEQGLPRGWLRLCQTAVAHAPECNISRGTSNIFMIHPSVRGLWPLHDFLRKQLVALLEIAEERKVSIHLPSEVLFHLHSPRSSAGVAPLSTEMPTRGRRSSDVGTGAHRNIMKRARSASKPTASEACSVEETKEGVEASAVEDIKEAPMFVVCHLPPSQLLWDVLRSRCTNLGESCDDVSCQGTAVGHQLAEQPADAESIGTYVTLTPNAITAAATLFRRPSFFLWLGAGLSRQTDGLESLLDAARMPDATLLMMQSLRASDEYIRGTVPFKQDRSPAASFLSSSVTNSNSRTCTADLSEVQAKIWTRHVLLFGSIAKNRWLLTEGRKVRVETFIDERPLLHMLQGRRLLNILLADNAFSLQSHVGLQNSFAIDSALKTVTEFFERLFFDKGNTFWPLHSYTATEIYPSLASLRGNTAQAMKSRYSDLTCVSHIACEKQEAIPVPLSAGTSFNTIVAPIVRCAESRTRVTFAALFSRAPPPGVLREWGFSISLNDRK
ncbi:uncharacterized protein LOC34621460 [Cyclospora cayetanensis]|uniref:Uncharacterized protein LOC34621460 n=1 Tax=Cyclospora cayetanensis TaxID=88456 RepID=A0A6P6RPZ2_9EIME|nr:uncharacterized protein LOC34621460 [Cyclospora cayetanensis]